MGEMRCLMLVAHFMSSSISSYLASSSDSPGPRLLCFLSNLSSLVRCAAFDSEIQSGSSGFRSSAPSPFPKKMGHLSRALVLQLGAHGGLYLKQ